MMKNIKQLILTFLLLTEVVSCAKIANSSQLRMDSPEAIEAVAKCIKDNVDQNRYKIYNIVWEEGVKLENKMFNISVEMIDATDCCYIQQFTVTKNIITPTSFQKINPSVEGLKFNLIKGLAPYVLDTELIKSQHDDAIIHIPMECVFKSVAYYRIYEEPTVATRRKPQADNSQSRIIGQFKFNVVGQRKLSSHSRDSDPTVSYELNFRAVLPDGQVRLVN